MCTYIYRFQVPGSEGCTPGINTYQYRFQVPGSEGCTRDTYINTRGIRANRAAARSARAMDASKGKWRCFFSFTDHAKNTSKQ